jgi:hypothetical protein
MCRTASPWCGENLTAATLFWSYIALYWSDFLQIKTIGMDMSYILCSVNLDSENKRFYSQKSIHLYKTQNVCGIKDMHPIAILYLPLPEWNNALNNVPHSITMMWRPRNCSNTLLIISCALLVQISPNWNHWNGHQIHRIQWRTSIRK